jgi:hypothetical protein
MSFYQRDRRVKGRIGEAIGHAPAPGVLAFFWRFSREQDRLPPICSPSRGLISVQRRELTRRRF